MYNRVVTGNKVLLKVNKLKIKRTDKEIDLSAALDRSVEVAVISGISETELVSRLRERFNSGIKSNVVALRQPPHKMFNPEAGP